MLSYNNNNQPAQGPTSSTFSSFGMFLSLWRIKNTLYQKDCLDLQILHICDSFSNFSCWPKRQIRFQDQKVVKHGLRPKTCPQFSIEAPSKSLSPIQVSPDWFWPKGEAELDARYRCNSTRKETRTPTQTDTNVYKYTDAGLVQIFWQADWTLDAALTDLGIGRCATLCLARETGFRFFWKSNLSRWKTRFVTTRTSGLVLDDQWISGCSAEKYLCWHQAHWSPILQPTVDIVFYIVVRCNKCSGSLKQCDQAIFW